MIVKPPLVGGHVVDYGLQAGFEAVDTAVHLPLQAEEIGSAHPSLSFMSFSHGVPFVATPKQSVKAVY